MRIVDLNLYNKLDEYLCNSVYVCVACCSKLNIKYKEYITKARIMSDSKNINDKVLCELYQLHRRCLDVNGFGNMVYIYVSNVETIHF